MNRLDLSAVWRILDANANRAAEGLRVIEDGLRYLENHGVLASQGKTLRHDFQQVVARLPLRSRLEARDVAGDVGSELKTAQEFERGSWRDVLSANFNRVQQALRSLEEFAKLVDVAAAAEFERLRYRAYAWERDCWTLLPQRGVSPRDVLCVLVDYVSHADDWISRIDDLIDAEVPLIQFRDKNLSDRELVRCAKQLRERTKTTATRLIINDRIDIAFAAAADGVHLGVDDLPFESARTLAPSSLLIGLSTHSLAQAKAAEACGADYIGVGPMFPSRSKDFTEFPGPELLRTVASQCTVPQFAIGGIGLPQLDRLIEAGARRVAVAAAIWHSDDIVGSARAFIDRLTLVDTPATP